MWPRPFSATPDQNSRESPGITTPTDFDDAAENGIGAQRCALSADEQPTVHMAHTTFRLQQRLLVLLFLLLVVHSQAKGIFRCWARPVRRDRWAATIVHGAAIVSLLQAAHTVCKDSQRVHEVCMMYVHTLDGARLDDVAAASHESPWFGLVGMLETLQHSLTLPTVLLLLPHTDHTQNVQPRTNQVVTKDTVDHGRCARETWCGGCIKSGTFLQMGGWRPSWALTHSFVRPFIGL